MRCNAHFHMNIRRSSTINAAVSIFKCTKVDEADICRPTYLLDTCLRRHRQGLRSTNIHLHKKQTHPSKLSVEINICSLPNLPQRWPPSGKPVIE